MRGSNKIAGIGAMLAAAWLLCVPYTVGAQLVSSIESKCASTMGKASAKTSKTVTKETAKCRDADISGKTIGACPNAANQTKIDSSKAKLTSSTVKKCVSTCSISGLECVASAYCPPLPNNNPPAGEQCSAGAANKPFDYHNIGFPGALCEAELSGQITNGTELGTCVGEITAQVSAALIDVIYGSITNASAISPEAASCLGSISKAGIKLSGTIQKGIVKCRDNINTGKVVGNPATCTLDDTTLAGKITKAQDKLVAAITDCGDTNIASLDICLQGPGAVTTTTDAIDCLVIAIGEVTDSTIATQDRVYAPVTLVEAAYPPTAACGDGVANQLPNGFFLLGEECDGADDSACPGNCLPPGDLYQCTCAGTVKRVRFQADGFTADLDNGWSGKSHNSGVTDKAGFITTFSACDCDAMTGATCTGTSGDPVCTVNGKQQPTCSWEPLGATRCEARGSDLDIKDENEDCYICDQFASNAGDFCTNEADCTGQCYPIAGGAATGACPNGQGDCGGGEICRGQCDRSQTCLIVPNGAPLPISSGGTAVCVLTTFRFDITGTQNIVTGEHAVNIQQFSKVHNGVSNTVPCPLCGGFCEGGFLAGDLCEGTCSTTTSTQCRFDSDCPLSETCTSASPQCTGGGTCDLGLTCHGGLNDGLPCRISAETDLFGTTSADCPPAPGADISSGGLQINFLPQTSEVVTLPPTLPCSAPGFELYDCPCPFGGGVAVRTRPNECGFACDTGLEFGIGCGSGSGAINGFPTTCDLGVNDGDACDEDTDCPGGTCSENPTHCLGDVAFDRFPCATNGDCGTGTCEDACPTGRCVPLCLTADNAFFPPGFGGDSADDPEEGLCAAGPPFPHCSGAADSFRICFEQDVDAGCLATCSISGNPCSPVVPCPNGEGECAGPCQNANLCEAGVDEVLGNDDDFPGAGVCIRDARNCFAQPIGSEGGDTLNGNGDPTNVRAVSTFCIPPTTNSAINAVTGLGGPGRLRQNGVNVTNGFTTLP